MQLTTHLFQEIWLYWWQEKFLIFLFFKKLFIYLFLAVLGLHCCVGFSLVAVSKGKSLVVVCRLLIVAASLVRKHRLQGAWASEAAVPGLQSSGSIVVVNGLNRSLVYGISLHQGWNPCLLDWQMDCPLSHQGSPKPFCFVLYLYIWFLIKVCQLFSGYSQRYIMAAIIKRFILW